MLHVGITFSKLLHSPAGVWNTRTKNSLGDSISDHKMQKRKDGFYEISTFDRLLWQPFTSFYFREKETNPWKRNFMSNTFFSPMMMIFTSARCYQSLTVVELWWRLSVWDLNDASLQEVPVPSLGMKLLQHPPTVSNHEPPDAGSLTHWTWNWLFDAIKMSTLRIQLAWKECGFHFLVISSLILTDTSLSNQWFTGITAAILHSRGFDWTLLSFQLFFCSLFCYFW